MSPTPLPGRPVRGSYTGRPLFALLDLITRKWSMRIVWELREGPRSFVELQRDCDAMSSSTLTTRLRELTDAKVVERDEAGTYRLTDIGAALPAAFDPLIDWSQRWADVTSA